jgi:protein-S-isoprenylcysteine O-methyltransferase
MKFVWQAWWMEWHPLVIPALLICLCGLVMRLMAFFTAKSNFTHRVKYYKRRGHELVTWGIYKYFRHPSYTGFYYYSIFSMVMLGNFISAIFFAAALTKFFRDRLEGEEESLF